MKALMERERTERRASMDYKVGVSSRLYPIMERSNESGSIITPEPQQESSLLMQSLKLDSSCPQQEYSRLVKSSSSKDGSRKHRNTSFSSSFNASSKSSQSRAAANKSMKVAS